MSETQYTESDEQCKNIQLIIINDQIVFCAGWCLCVLFVSTSVVLDLSRSILISLPKQHFSLDSGDSLHSFPGSAGDCQPLPVHQYGTPIDYTPIDFSVIGDSAARLLSDVPDNTTRLEHLSFTNLLLNLSRLTCCNLLTVQSPPDRYMQMQQGATCADNIYTCKKWVKRRGDTR